MRTRSSAAAKSAFTLIELLVVIVVISILAALILTAIGRATHKSKRIQCVNNVRQLGIALHGFVSANHAYPLGINPEFWEGRYLEHHASWKSALQHEELESSGSRQKSLEYSKRGIWKCPSANTPAEFPKIYRVSNYGYNSDGVRVASFSDSLGLGGHNAWREPIFPSPPVKEYEVINPSRMMAIGDAFAGGNGIISDIGEFMRYSVQDFMGSTKRANLRHQSHANVVFCDGHVESPTLKFLFDDTSSKALSRWNRDNEPHHERLSH